MHKSRIHKNFRQPSSSFSAKADTDTKKKADAQHQSTKPYRSNIQFVDHVSVEEWDCPKPGAKKYMPKAVKENIRKNFRKMNSGPGVSTDSLRVSN